MRFLILLSKIHAALKRNADRTLFRRCITVIHRRESSPRRMMWLFNIAMLYYISVRMFGGLYFKFNKEQ